MKKILTLILIIMSASTSAQVNWQNNPVGAVFAREGGESPDGTFRLYSDGIEVFTLISSDKTEFYQPASLFYGENDADKARVDALAPSGKVASSMNCFLVNYNGRKILIDTGLPSSRGGKTVDRLLSLGIKTSDIDAIYITHSHHDHIGGLLEEDTGATYPNASLYISSTEWDYLKGTSQEMADNIEKAYNGRIITFQAGEILQGDILPVAAPGHTPGHVVYNLGNLLFVGDILHGESVQLIYPDICANFDADRKEAVISREKILRYAVGRSLTVLGAHIPNNGVLF